MTLNEKLQSAVDSKNAIKSVLQGGGVNTEGVKFSDYAEKIQILADSAVKKPVFEIIDGGQISPLFDIKRNSAYNGDITFIADGESFTMRGSFASLRFEPEYIIWIVVIYIPVDDVFVAFLDNGFVQQIDPREIDLNGQFSQDEITDMLVNKILQFIFDYDEDYMILQQQYNELQSSYDELQSSYDDLQSLYSDWYSPADYNQLQDELLQIQQEYSGYYSPEEYDMLQRQYEDLQRQYDELEQQLNGGDE